MGDSLADVGTFGIEFTIQGNRDLSGSASRRPTGWAGLQLLPPMASPSASTKPGCTNYAVGGGVINAGSGLVATDPRVWACSSPLPPRRQLQPATCWWSTAAATFRRLVGAPARRPPAANRRRRRPRSLALLGTQPSPTQVQAAAAGGAAGLAAASGTWTALAGSFTSIKGGRSTGAPRASCCSTCRRHHGALPGRVTASPRPTAPTAPARVRRPMRLPEPERQPSTPNWRAALRGNASVAIVGTSRRSMTWSTPAQFGFTDVTHTACPATGVGADDRPPTFATCTDAALAANLPPAPVAVPTGYKNWALIPATSIRRRTHISRSRS